MKKDLINPICIDESRINIRVIRDKRKMKLRSCNENKDIITENAAEKVKQGKVCYTFIGLFGDQPMTGEENGAEVMDRERGKREIASVI